MKCVTCGQDCGHDHEINELNILARRFQGVDVSYRAQIGKWRAINYASKNQRANYRVCGVGDTPLDAIVDLLRKIKDLDEVNT